MYLSVQDVHHTLAKRKLRQYESFERVLELCFKKIRRFTDIEKTFCLYEVPEFIVSYPLYDLNECILYIIDKLQLQGFKVQYIFPNVLKIDWGVGPTTVLPSPQQMAEVDVKLLANKQIASHLSSVPKTLTYEPAVQQPTSKIDRKQKQNQFIKSIADFKPSGKFVLDLT